jgi:hypothetical protein
MIGSESMNTSDAAGNEGGWALLADHDGAASLVGAIVRINPDDTYTKTELSDAADVAYKSLYLSGTVEALVDAGLLDREEAAGQGPTFSVDTDSAAFEAAAAFDDALE